MRAPAHKPILKRKFVARLVLVLIICASIAPSLLPVPFLEIPSVMASPNLVGMKQVIIGGYYDGALSSTDTTYGSLVSGQGWYTTEALNYKIVSTDGVIKNLRFKLTGSPGAGKKYTFTLMLNGAPTALTFDIADTATSGSDMIHVITVAPGDTVSIQCDPDNSPTSRKAFWSCIFKGDTARESLILGGSNIVLNSGVTEYGQVMGANTNPTGTENNIRQVCPTNGTIKNLYIKLNIDPGTDTDAYRFTLRKNGESTDLAVTVTADDTTGNNIIDTADVVAGDVLTMMFEPLNTPSATPYAIWGMTFIADIGGESIMLGGSYGDLDATLTEYEYILPRMEGIGWTATESLRYQLGQACTFKNLHILLSNPPGDGNSYDFTVRIAGADSNVVATVSGAATTGNSGALEDTVADDEYVNLKVVPTDTPDVADAYWGLVCYIEPGMKQVIFGGRYYSLSISSTPIYNSLIAGGQWYSNAVDSWKVISTDGVIESLRVVLVNGAPGAGKSYAFTLMLNGAPTALTCTIADDATHGSDMVNKITVTGGDYVNLRAIASNTPTERVAFWTTVFEGDKAKESLILGGSHEGTLDATETDYATVMGARNSFVLAEHYMRQVVPTNGTFKNFYVKMVGSPGADPKAYNFTLRKNGESTGLTVTITGPATSGSDLVHTVDVVAGDILTLMIEPLNTPTEGQHVSWSFTFLADIDGESIVLGGSYQNLDANLIEFQLPTGDQGYSWDTTEILRQLLGQVCTLKKLHILLTEAPGDGNKYDFTIRIAGVDSKVVATVDGLNTIGDSGELEDEVDLDDYVSLGCDPDDVPTVAKAYFGFVCFIGPLGDRIVNREMVASDPTVDDEQWFFLNASMEVFANTSIYVFTRIDIDPVGMNLSCSYTNSTNTFVEENDPNNYLQLNAVISVKTDLSSTFVRIDFYVRLHQNATKDGAYDVKVYSTAAEDLSDTDTFSTVFTLTMRTPSTPTKLFGAGFNASSPYVELYWTHDMLLLTVFEVQDSPNNVDWTYLGQNTTREYTDTTVVNGTERYYRVRACKTTGAGWKNSTFIENFETVYFVEAAGAVAGDTIIMGAAGVFWIVLIILVPIVAYLVKKR